MLLAASHMVSKQTSEPNQIWNQESEWNTAQNFPQIYE